MSLSENVRGRVRGIRLQQTCGRPNFGVGGTSLKWFPEGDGVILAVPCIIGDPLAELERETIWQTALCHFVRSLHIHTSCHVGLV